MGVLNGDSLFVWRSWLGLRACIIGTDLNPGAAKWAAHGFEIHIGDRGDLAFWRDVFALVGRFDALMDDGGRQAFEQIATLAEALRACQWPGLVVIVAAHTSVMKAFCRHLRRTCILVSSRPC